MPAAQSTKIAALTMSRARIVPRQLSDLGSLTVLLQRLRDHRCRRRFRRHDALDDDRCAGLRGDELQPSKGQRLDPLRRLERLDLEAEVAVDLFLVAASLLHLFEAVAVLQKLDALPPRKQ